MAEQSKTDSTNEKLLKEAIERFKSSVEENSECNDRMKDELKFAAGDQWPQEVKDARENDPNGARPCLTMDKLGQYVRQVVNDSRQNKPAIKVRPVDSGADVEVANILQGLIRHIEDNSNSDVAYDTAIDSSAKVGIGWFRIRTVMINPQRNEQEIIIDPVENIFAVTPGPWKKPDGSDMEWCFITEEVPRKQFEKDYPKADVKGWCSDDTGSQWVTEETVRVAEYYKLVKEESNCLYLDNGEEMDETAYWEMYAQDQMRPEIIGSYTKEKRTIKWYKLVYGEVLDETEVPCSYIPVIPVIGNVNWVDGKRKLTGMVHWGMDGQRAYNYARSAFVEQIALAPKAPFIAAAGQIEDFESEWAQANTSNQPVLRYNTVDINGTPVPPPQRQPAPQPSSGWFQEMQVSGRDIQDALGMHNASIGAEGQEKSGRAILARQREGDTSTFHYIDNLSKSIRHAGRIIIEMIPKVMDTRRMVRIIGEDGTPDQAVLDPKMSQPYAKIQTAEGKYKKLFNPNIGKYDVTVTVGPAYNTRRMEAADSMVELVRNNPAIFPIIGDLMVKSMDWPMAEEIAKRLKLMAPPQIQQADQDQEEGRVQAAVQQAMQQMEQQVAPMLEAFQKLQQEHEAMKQDKSVEAAKLDIEARKVAIDEYKAETERAKALAPAFDPAQIQALVIQTIQQMMTPQDFGAPNQMPEPMPDNLPMMNEPISGMPQ